MAHVFYVLRNLSKFKVTQIFHLFFPVSFIVLGFIFRSVICLELIFMGMGYELKFFFFFPHMDLVVTASFVEKTVFSVECIVTFAVCQLTIYVCVYLWILYSVPFMHVSVCSAHTVLIAEALLSVLKNKYCEFSFVHLQILSIPLPLLFHIRQEIVS